MAKSKAGEWLTPEGLLQIEAWARDGLTREDIAHNCGIHRATLNEWEKRHTDIADALKSGKDIADVRVENALYKRATGYTFKETRVEYECGVEVKRIETIKEIPPETAAGIFWLKNRRPDRWRDKQQVEANVDSELHVSLADELKDFAQ